MPAENGEPFVGQSYLMWFLQTLGLGGLLVALAALTAFVLTLVVVLRGRGTNVGAALVFIVPLPVLVSVFWVLKGMIASFSVITTSNVELKGSEVAGGISEMLVTPFFGLLSMAPSYLLAMFFLFGRSVQAGSTGEASNEK